MIKLLRVDDRLLHGQVAFSWVRNLKIHTIVIADDRIVYDEFSKMILGLSKPSGIVLKIMGVQEAVEFLKEESYSSMNVMAIVNSVQNARFILEELEQLDSLNLGALRIHLNAEQVSEEVALDEGEIKICQQIIKQGKKVVVQCRYDDEPIDLALWLNQHK